MEQSSPATYGEVTIAQSANYIETLVQKEATYSVADKHIPWKSPYPLPELRFRAYLLFFFPLKWTIISDTEAWIYKISSLEQNIKLAA